MKIAIPTDDGIRLSSFPKNPKGYLIITVEGGEIINEEIRWNQLNDIQPPDKSILKNLMDCSFFIVKNTSNDRGEFLPSKTVEIITSKEEIITNTIMEFLNTTLLRESNTCCSP